MAQWNIPRINSTELASTTPTVNGDIVYVTDLDQILVGDASTGNWMNVMGLASNGDTYKISTGQLSTTAVQTGNIPDNEITFEKIEQIPMQTMLGNNTSVEGDIQELTTAEVTTLLDLNLGDRLERIEDDDAFNVIDNLLANTYRFSTLANRNSSANLQNAGLAATEIRWNPGDIAVVKNDTATNVYIYVGDEGKAPPLVNADFIEITLSAQLVNTSFIANDAITNAKVADNAIQTENIVNDNVTYEKIQNISTANRVLGSTTANGPVSEVQVQTDMIADDAVTVDKMAADSVDSDQYVDGSIDTVHIADAQITNAKMAADSVDSDQYVDGSIDTAHIADDQVTYAKIQNVATANRLLGSTVGGGVVTELQLQNAMIPDGEITAAKLAGSILGSDLNDGAVDTDQLADSAVETDKINDSAVTNAKINNDAVDGTKIADNSINSEHYVDGSIDTAHIANDQVTFAKMQNVTGITVLGKSDAGAGNIEEISLATLSGGNMLNLAENTRDTINTALAAGTHNGIDVTTSDSGNSISISHADTSSAASVTESNRTYLSGITLDTYGHVTATDTQGITAGNGVQISVGGEISVTSTHAAETVVFTSIANRNAARAAGWNQGDIAIVNLASDTHSYIYHGTNGNTAATTDADWAELSFSSGDNTTYSFASGTTGNFTVTPQVGGVNQTAQTVTVGHPNISAASSVNNSGRTYIQDITLDSNGHVTGTTSATETVVNTNTTYSAGSGLSLSGTTFSHTDTSSQASVNNTGNTFIQDVTLDTYGHVTGLTSAGATDTNTTYSAANNGGLSLSGTAFSHADTSSQASVNNTGNTFIQDVTLDGFGHVTALVSAGATDTNTTYSAGNGLSLSGTTFSHSDTSSQASVNNSGTTFIQDVTLDTYGHVTALGSATVDAGGASVTVSDTAPSSPEDGDLWYYQGGTDEPARLYVYIDDDSAWVDAAPAAIPNFADMVVIEEESNGTPVVADFIDGAIFVAQY